jgi:hypothetical protein
VAAAFRPQGEAGTAGRSMTRFGNRPAAGYSSIHHMMASDPAMARITRYDMPIIISAMLI